MVTINSWIRISLEGLETEHTHKFSHGTQSTLTKFSFYPLSVYIFPLNLNHLLLLKFFPAPHQEKMQAANWCMPTTGKTGSFLRGHGID